MKKRKRYHLIVIPVVLLALPALYYAAGPRASREYLGVKLGATPEEVRAALGAPNKETPLPHALASIWLYRQDDREVSVGFTKGGPVFYVLCEGAGCPPLRGVRYGDALDEVLRRLGRPQSASTAKDGLELVLRYDGRNLTFTVNHLHAVIGLGVVNPRPSYDEKDIERILRERAEAERISMERSGERPGEGPVSAALRKTLEGGK